VDQAKNRLPQHQRRAVLCCWCVCISHSFLGCWFIPNSTTCTKNVRGASKCSKGASRSLCLVCFSTKITSTTIYVNCCQGKPHNKRDSEWASVIYVSNSIHQKLSLYKCRKVYFEPLVWWNLKGTGKVEWGVLVLHG